MGEFFNQTLGRTRRYRGDITRCETGTQLTNPIRQIRYGLDPSLPVHPTSLYEFIANMVIS